MVSSVAEALAAPIAEGAQKPDQQTDGEGFMAMLAGLVSAQPGLVDQMQPAEAVCAAADAAPQTELVVHGDVSADDTQIGKSKTMQDEPEMVDAAVTAAPRAPLQEAPIGAESPEPEDQTGIEAAVKALKDLTVHTTQADALPEAAKPESEIAASVVAARLNPMGQNSRMGAVLLNANAESEAREEPSKSAAAAAIAGGRAPEKAPADGGTRIQVEWKPTEPVTISRSSNGSFEGDLRFANGNAAQPEPVDLSVGTNSQQTFGLEMKAQMGTATIIRQAQSAPAQTPQMDHTLGEKMVGQVVREVTLHKLGENTTLSIRLDPPELGTLRVSVTSQSGVLTTQLESPNAVVRGILETHLPALKDALASAGVEVSKFSVSSGLDFGTNAQRQQQAWQPARMTPAIDYSPQMQDMQPAIEAAFGGSQTQTASHSWLA